MTKLVHLVLRYFTGNTCIFKFDVRKRRSILSSATLYFEYPGGLINPETLSICIQFNPIKLIVFSCIIPNTSGLYT